MADSKITALAALTAADPVNDMFPVVDVSDTSMAASGTTKRISVNNILGASGTATLASATITGALGAANLNVTGAGIPANGMYLGSANNLSFSYASTLGMTLNSTGLGIGVSPTYNIDVLGATLPTIAVRATSAGASNARLYLECAGTNGGNVTYNRSLQALQLGANGATSAQVTLESLGNFITTVPTTPPTLSTNSQMVFNLTSNTNLRISVRGTDGTTRTANITLA